MLTHFYEMELVLQQAILQSITRQLVYVTPEHSS